MLNLLKESVNSSHGEHLEAIVILLMCVFFKDKTDLTKTVAWRLYWE